MSGFFQQFLQGAGDGFLGTPYLRDFTHASNIFVTNAYGNSPKYKWLFHVYFEINKPQVANAWDEMSQQQIGRIFPSTSNPGLLVKSIDLPKYSVGLQEMNQYNRKRYVQTKINYDPVRITFHDDNDNQIRQLWHTYYSYYYNDPSQPWASSGTRYDRYADTRSSAALNLPNTYDPRPLNTDWGYSAEFSRGNSSISNGYTFKTPFFKSIKIYGFNQHNFALYVLHNPIIESFQHDNYNYYDTRGIMENSMQIRYESVKYYDGAINGRDPGAIVMGFGEENVYDRTLSPISRPGSNTTILGQGGLVDAGVGVLENLSRGDAVGVIGAAGILARTNRTLRNSNQIKQGARAEVVSGVTSAINTNTRFNFPARNANTGPGAQNSTSSASIYNRTTPPAVST